MKRWLVRAVWAAVLIFATVVIGGAVDARRRLPDLESWHRYVPADATASDLETATLADYLQREDTVFRDVRDRIERTSAGSAAPPANRYDSRSRSHPSRIGSDGNRTYEIVPAGEIAGGALLIHGLTDSPYSMRAVGETLKASGYYGLALRMPGHGTVPAGLTTAVWEDWLAAVRVGVRHVRERIGPDKPLVLVGYSNGGALVLKYALDEVERGDGLRRTRLVLISPMIGVPPFAWMARVISLLGPIPYFEKARWLDVMPEYNPFKYNSFPANAGLAVVAVDDRGAGADPPPRQSRPPEGSAAGARVPVARRRHGQHRRGGARAVRSARRQRIGARALRHQPVVGDGAVHRPGGRHDPVAAHRRVAATLRALARDQRRSAIRSRWSSARSVRTGPRSSRGRSDSPGRPRCSRSRTSPCRSPSTTTCMAGTRGRRRSTWCGWAPSVREASARC